MCEYMFDLMIEVVLIVCLPSPLHQVWVLYLLTQH